MRSRSVIVLHSEGWPARPRSLAGGWTSCTAGNGEGAEGLARDRRTLETGSRDGCCSYRLRAFRRDRLAPPSALTPLERSAARVRDPRVERATEKGGCALPQMPTAYQARRERPSQRASALERRTPVDRTGVFPNASQLRPSILMRAPGAQPVVIEAEFDPASSVKDDTRNRLGLIPASASDPIEQVIAARLPKSLRQGHAGLPARIAAAEFGYCVISGDRFAPVRWAAGGWLTGGIDDIVRSIEHIMVSQCLIDEGISILGCGVRDPTGVEDAKLRGFGVIEQQMGPVLNERNGGQTARVAMTLIANAMTIDASIVGPHDIPSVGQIQAEHPGSLQAAVLATWRKILAEVNYWRIFKVASDLLAPVRLQTANRILDPLAQAADQLANLGVSTRHDLSGRMFRNLIVDRKLLATFYTLPTSATLLADLAARRLDTDWSDLLGNKRFAIADLSCGTGALLSAAYHAVLTRFRQAGGDDSKIHRHMIEHSIIGTDIATPDGQRLRGSPSETVCLCRSS